MPLFFFDIVDGEDNPDLIGTDLASREVARSHAISIAMTYLHELDSNTDALVSITVKTETGEVVDIVHPIRGKSVKPS